MSLIELQVADLDVLFDEQVIQERLLKLEGTSDQTAVELAEINANIEVEKWLLAIFNVREGWNIKDWHCSIIQGYLGSTISGLQVTDVNHDARISALEENGGGGSGSQNGLLNFALSTRILNRQTEIKFT